MDQEREVVMVTRQSRRFKVSAAVALPQGTEARPDGSVDANICLRNNTNGEVLCQSRVEQGRMADSLLNDALEAINNPHLTLMVTDVLLELDAACKSPI